MGLGYVVARGQRSGRIVGRRRTRGPAFWIAAVGTVMTAAGDPARAEHGALHVLSAAAGAPALLHRRDAAGGRLVDLGRRDDCAATASWRRDAPRRAACRWRCTACWRRSSSGIWRRRAWRRGRRHADPPWSLGLVDAIDPIVARTYFWWFGHPLVYFWLLPAYVLWYTCCRAVAGGKLFSDPLARVVFVLFILFSTPVGLPSPVHRSRHQRRLEAGPHLHHLRDHVSEPGHGVHGDRLARGRRPA